MYRWDTDFTSPHDYASVLQRVCKATFGDIAVIHIRVGISFCP